MSAVWVRVRSDLRRRWRAWVLLGLLFGAVLGASMTAAAGARRAETAYPRFVHRYKAADVNLGGVHTDDPNVAAQVRKQIISLPEVADYSESAFVSNAVVLPSGETLYFPEILVSGDSAGRELVTINRVKVLKGRLYDPSAADEGMVDFNTADRFHLHVGDKVGVPLGDQNTGDPRPISYVRIVGIGVVPGSLPAVGSANLGGVLVTPAFMHLHAALLPPNTDAPVIRLRRGSPDIPSFIKRVEALKTGVDVPQTLPTHLIGVSKTLRYEVQALWILAGLIAVAGIAIFGQAISRQINAEADEHPILLTIGMTPRQLVAVGMVRASGLALVAAVTAGLVAFAASPLTPIGLSRLVEPSPGFRFDALIVLGGAGAVVAIVLLASVVPIVRAALRASRSSEDASSRPSRAASVAAAVGAGPSAVTGLRLALETGRGTRSVPVRSALLGVALAVASFAAAGTFSSSLDHLVTTPRLYGYGWDFITVGDTTAHTRSLLEHDPQLAAIARGGATNVRIGDVHLIPFTYDAGKGIAPTMLSGRAPAADDEIALGSSLLARLHLKIGSSIPVQVDNEECPATPRPMRVVGKTVVPTFFFQAVEPGQSSAITLAGYERLLGPSSRCERGDQAPLIVLYKPGTDVSKKLASLQDKIPGLFTIQVRRSAAELSAVSRSSGVPLTLTEVLLFMAVATLIHVLVTSVRKRRHDLAILKTLGFERRQVRSAVAWQATTLTVIALVFGLPIGIAVGRSIWTFFAGSIGVVPEPAVRLVFVLLAIPVGIIAANLIAALPARAAARTKPALVLRAE